VRERGREEAERGGVREGRHRTWKTLTLSSPLRGAASPSRFKVRGEGQRGGGRGLQQESSSDAAPVLNRARERFHDARTRRVQEDHRP
jgi:hypothetical protein